MPSELGKQAYPRQEEGVLAEILQLKVIRVLASALPSTKGCRLQGSQRALLKS